MNQQLHLPHRRLTQRARIDTERRKRNHVRQLEVLGYTVTLQPAA